MVLLASGRMPKQRETREGFTVSSREHGSLISEHACCFNQARVGVQLLGKVQATPGIQVGERMGARRRITAWGVTPCEDSGFRVEWVGVSLLPDPGVKAVQGHSPMAGDAPREVLTRPPPISPTHLWCKLPEGFPLPCPSSAPY